MFDPYRVEYPREEGSSVGFTHGYSSSAPAGAGLRRVR